jgi:hypothetical protein
MTIIGYAMTIIIYAIPYHSHVIIITWVDDHDFKRSCDHGCQILYCQTYRLNFLIKSWLI